MTDVFQSRLKKKVYIWRRSDECKVHTLPYRPSDCNACGHDIGRLKSQDQVIQEALRSQYPRLPGFLSA